MTISWAWETPFDKNPVPSPLGRVALQQCPNPGRGPAGREHILAEPRDLMLKLTRPGYVKIAIENGH